MKTRIAKVIADSGFASRREAERLIKNGQVTVNGETVITPVHFIDDSDEIKISGKVINKKPELEIFAFHKPINTVTTTSDPQKRKTIYDCIPKKYRNLKYIGRLDYKTTGLLLLTNNGEAARKLTLPESNIPRVYIATVKKMPSADINPALNGITVDGITYKPMKINIISYNTLRVEVTEGKKNEVRIVLKACGYPVIKLHRVSFGPVKLGKLPVSRIEKLPQKTIDELLKTL